MRRAFVETLSLMAEQNPKVVFLTGDLGYGVFDDFRDKFGPRYVNVGIAEAQLVCAAAGLAIEGYRPFIYSIASFVTGRPFEQIRINISYPKLPVVIIGAGGGYSYAESGTTHHSVEDLALMSLLPGMTVVSPGSPDELKELLPQLLGLDSPSYMRIGKFGEPNFYSDEPAILGRARLLKNGKDVAVLSVGEMAPIVLNAVSELKYEGINPIVYQIHTIKPFDSNVINELASSIKAIIIVEESTPMMGVSSAVMAWGASDGHPIKLLRLGPPDSLALGNPSRQSLRHRFGYDSYAIKTTCRSVWINIRAQ